MEKVEKTCFAPLRAGWLAYIREIYPDGPVAPAATVGEESLLLGDRVLDALGLYAHWSPGMNVPIGKFSAMNAHPNCNLISEIISII
jgi:hypothetical protein